MHVVLIILGALLALFGGGCTLIMVGLGVADPPSIFNEMGSSSWMLLPLGMLPLGVGFFSSAGVCGSIGGNAPKRRCRQRNRQYNRHPLRVDPLAIAPGCVLAVDHASFRDSSWPNFSRSRTCCTSCPTALETVLGFDNLLYISIEAKRVDAARQKYVRQVGIILAIGLRIALLFVVLQLIEAFQNAIPDRRDVPCQRHGQRPQSDRPVGRRCS